ncbi:MAG TPA: helix-turn-helix domain-containing protein [Myxococcaceae bacterium]|nr:helix-turn-helix domain-containing protein [Myxococcaceae bacterium]
MDDLRPASRLDIAAAAALLSEPARVSIVSALMDGQARPATELARIAGVSPSTGSEHLALLTRGGLLRVEQQGRHRYHRLASDAVARAFESLSLLTTRPVRAASVDPEDAAFRRARTCYRHLAGELGVALVEALVSRRHVHRSGARFLLTSVGRRTGLALGLLDLEWEPLEGRACLDWTERRDHLAGPLGVALAKGLLELGWVRRKPGTRALRISVEGARGLREAFGLAVDVG